MPTKLLEIKPQKGLESGIFPSTPNMAIPVWKDSLNIVFKSASIERAPGANILLPDIGGAPRAMAQASINGVPRLYYEVNAEIFKLEAGVSTALGNLTGDPWFETYGTWLVMTDYVEQPQVWKNTGAFIEIGASEFTKAKLIRRFAEHLVAFGTDTLPSGVHWCSAGDVEDWTAAAANSAGDLPLRDLDSDIVTACPMGSYMSVYSADTLSLLSYVGHPNYFGARPALNGVGAVSRKSVVQVGTRNYGLNRRGIFGTDGLSFNYFDDPAVSDIIQQEIDWTKPEEIIGYHNEQLYAVVWYFPNVQGGREGLGFDYNRKTFFRLGETITFALERQVFAYPIGADETNLTLLSANQTSFKNAALRSKPFDAGDSQLVKMWDYILLEGRFDTGIEVRCGFSDDPEAEPDWTEWEQAQMHVPLNLRESVYLTFELRAYNVPAAVMKMSGLTIYGELAGFNF